MHTDNNQYSIHVKKNRILFIAVRVLVFVLTIWMVRTTHHSEYLLFVSVPELTYLVMDYTRGYGQESWHIRLIGALSSLLTGLFTLVLIGL